MKKKVLTALAAAGVTVSVWQAANAESCIISGSTNRVCSAAAFAASADFDSRLAAIGYGQPLAEFSSYPPGLLLIVR